MHDTVTNKYSASTSCNGWHHHRCKECLCQWLKEKRHQRKLQPVTTTMCASGVSCAGWWKDNTTSGRCKGQGARCKGQERRYKGQDQHQHKSVRDAATTFNYNHYHHRPGPTQHDDAITATCVRAQIPYKPLYAQVAVIASSCWPLHLALVVLFFYQLASASTPLAHMVVVTGCNLCWRHFSISHNNIIIIIYKTKNIQI